MLKLVAKLVSFLAKIARQSRGQELMEICLFQMPGDPDNVSVLRKLKELPGVSVTELMFRPDDTPQFSTPYVVVGSPRRDGPFPGVDGIRYFIEKVYPSYQRA